MLLHNCHVIEHVLKTERERGGGRGGEREAGKGEKERGLKGNNITTCSLNLQ